MMARSKKFRPLSEALPEVIKRLGLDREIEIQQLLSRWPEMVDERLAAHTRAVTVEKGVLIIAVDSPVWMTQLRFLKGQIMRKISPRFRSGLVRDIRFVLDYS